MQGPINGLQPLKEDFPSYMRPEHQHERVSLGLGQGEIKKIKTKASEMYLREIELDI